MRTEKLKYDILSIEERAVRSKLNGHPVINGCVGMLYREDGTLCDYPEVDEKLKDRFASYLSYPAVLGSESYRKGVLAWVFGKDLSLLEKKYAIPFSATLGGTGAIAMAFDKTAREKGVLILSDICWPNYRNIADFASLPTVTYRFLGKDRKFDFTALEKAIDQGLSKHKKALVVINDPCHNPTGYCLSLLEYRKLFALLSSYHGKVMLLMDIAYADYAPMGFLFPEMLLRKKIAFPCYVAFSASKSFGLYGLRLGALFALFDKKSDPKEANDIFRTFARSTYSCPNNGAMGPLSELLNDPACCQAVKAEIRHENERLAYTGNLLSKTLDDLKIDHLPYLGGFYITVNVPDAIEVCQKLERRDVYFSPMGKKQIRIAVSGLSRKDVAELKTRLALL
jgi:aromatic-amino-acid transaminase